MIALSTMQLSKLFAGIELYHNQVGVLVHIKVLVTMVSSKVGGPPYFRTKRHMALSPNTGFPKY